MSKAHEDFKETEQLKHLLLAMENSQLALVIRVSYG